MMGIETILSLRREAKNEARRQQLQPRVFFNSNDREENFGDLPNFGDYRARGWRQAEHRTVDSSGFGDETEPALTVRGFKAWAAEHPLDGFAIIEQGQFQIVIARFVRLGGAK